jgi:hypothetical protein
MKHLLACVSLVFCCSTAAPGAEISRYDLVVEGKTVEALLFQPAGDGRFPGVLLIPEYQRTARNLIPLGSRLAAAHFAAVSVSQRGFGGSEGPPDLCRPQDLARDDCRLPEAPARAVRGCESHGHLRLLARRNRRIAARS